jgi:hypothetical protein
VFLPLGAWPCFCSYFDILYIPVVSFGSRSDLCPVSLGEAPSRQRYEAGYPTPPRDGSDGFGADGIMVVPPLLTTPGVDPET